MFLPIRVINLVTEAVPYKFGRTWNFILMVFMRKITEVNLIFINLLFTNWWILISDVDHTDLLVNGSKVQISLWRYEKCMLTLLILWPFYWDKFINWWIILNLLECLGINTLLQFVCTLSVWTNSIRKLLKIGHLHSLSIENVFFDMFLRDTYVLKQL